MVAWLFCRHFDVNVALSDVRRLISSTQLLPAETQGVVVVVESCGLNSTFRLDGSKAVFLGEGDLHEDDFLGMVVSAPFVGNNTECQHALHVFPSQILEDSFQTSIPVMSTIIVVCIFMFAVVIFLVYDFVVSRRQSKAENSANRTGAIVEQFFPEVIRKQLFSAIPQTRKKPGLLDRSTRHDRDTHKTDRRPSGLHRSLHRSNSVKFSKVDMKSAASKSMAIAELYPETTVFFAEIPSFTAWSSIREPAQIFMLLESVFAAFDDIARKRKVFKVETVGDCYVAAMGVPDANKDHAIIMARFARECMHKFHEVVHGLELTLGPDTSELGLRIGLHSGPITAGVLRGDRARFQLFGDTVGFRGDSFVRNRPRECTQSILLFLMCSYVADEYNRSH